MNLKELQQQKRNIRAKLNDLIRVLKSEKRDFTSSESREWESLKIEYDEINDKIEEAREHQTCPEDRALSAGASAPLDEQRGFSQATDPGGRMISSQPLSNGGFDSMGSFLTSVIRAGMGRGTDERLMGEQRAYGMNETIPSEGGFLVAPQFSSQLLQRTYSQGILPGRCFRLPLTKSSSIRIPAVDETSRANGSRLGGIQLYWNAEAAELTKSKPKIRQMELSLKKLTGLCYLTDELLADAPMLEAFTTKAFSDEFSFVLDDVLIRGTGAGQPLGILASNGLVTVAKETNQYAKTILYENIVNMWSRCWGKSRANAVWLINQDCEPQLSKMSLTVGTGGVPVYMPASGISGSPYATLMGRPLIPFEQCDTLGQKGDIILADFGEYLLTDTGQIKSASSIHVRFLYDEMALRFTYRVDGQPIWNNPLTPYKGSNSLSPFVCLAERA